MSTSANLSAYRDIGRVANATEPRSSAMTKGSDGCYYLVITSRGFVVSTNLNTKETGCYPFPDGYIDYPYGSLASKSGKVYFGAGKMFYEFDPVKKEYTFADAARKSHEGFLCDGYSLVEGEDGMIYFAACPVTYLTGFNPQTREFVDFGIIDETQEYPGSLAIDKAGWLYCGIGTSKQIIVAYNLKTMEKRVLGTETNYGKCAETHKATDGNVYGAFDGRHTCVEYSPNKHWYRLYDGELKEEKKDAFVNEHIGSDTFYEIHCPFTDHPAILTIGLAEHELQYIHPDTGETVTLELDYECGGADLSPLTEAPNGLIYGTTNHPIQLYTYNPKTDELINYGKKLLAGSERFAGAHNTGWGNICAYAAQGDILAGAAYCGGLLVRIDTREPVNTDVPDANPHVETFYNEVLRPRSGAAMPDGRTTVFGGYNVYGETGGGLIVYDVVDRTSRVIMNENLIPDQNVLAIVPMSDTTILCGTCIEAPGGGLVKAKEAVIALYDIVEEKILYSFVPIPGARTIAHMKMDQTGMVHGITAEGIYFAYDPDRREVLRTQNLSEYGGAVRDGMKIDTDGTIYGLLNHAIYRITPGTPEAEIISVPPCDICSGMAIIDNKIYFGGSMSHLWCYTIEEA